MSTEVKLDCTCAFCGSDVYGTVQAPGLHAEAWCPTCKWSMEEHAGNLVELTLRIRRRPGRTEALEAVAQTANALYWALEGMALGIPNDTEAQRVELEKRLKHLNSLEGK